MIKKRISEYSNNITLKSRKNNNSSLDSTLEQDEPDTEDVKNNQIAALAVGGCGSNILSYIYSAKTIDDVDFYAINTDKGHLEDKVHEGISKILIGKEITSGLGAGHDPQKGKKAVLKSEEQIKQILKGKNIIYLIAGLGKGTGGGASIEIAHIAKAMEIVILGIFVCAAFDEGELVQRNALKSLEELEDIVDTSTIILNDRLNNLEGTAAEVEQKQTSIPADSVRTVSEIISAVLKRNIDLNDAKRVLQKSGRTVFIREEANGGNRVQDILTKIQSKHNVTNCDIKGAEKILFCILAHSEAYIQNSEIFEIKKGIKKLLQILPDTYIPGIGFDQTLDKDSIRILMIATSFTDDNKAISELKESYKKEAELFEGQFIFSDIQHEKSTVQEKEENVIENQSQLSTQDKTIQDENTNNNTSPKPPEDNNEPIPRVQTEFNIEMAILVRRDFAGFAQKCAKDLTDAELKDIRNTSIPKEYLDWTPIETPNNRINIEGHVD